MISQLYEPVNPAIIIVHLSELSGSKEKVRLADGPFRTP